MDFVIWFSGGLDFSGDFCDMVFREDWTFLEDIMILRTRYQCKFSGGPNFSSEFCDTSFPEVRIFW